MPKKKGKGRKKRPEPEPEAEEDVDVRARLPDAAQHAILCSASAKSPLAACIGSGGAGKGGQGGAGRALGRGIGTGPPG